MTPIISSNNQKPTKPLLPEANPASALETELAVRSVYVVEDHARLRSLIVRYIDALAGLSVIGQAASAEAALNDPLHAKANIILTDLDMPGMKGLELTRRLVTAQPERIVILLTAHSENYYAEKAFGAGASAYIVKGDPHKLEGVIKRVLAGERGIQAKV